MKGRVLFLKQDAFNLYYQDMFNSGTHSISTPLIIKDYFNLSVSVVDLYKQWSKCDPHFAKTIEANGESFKGIRMLRQDPWENLCSFICSSNNNIKRISQMVENLCTHFGTFLGEVDGIKYYDFPTPQQLAKPETEEKLRALGFGYRAKYIQKTAVILCEKDDAMKYLETLRTASYKDAHNALLEFSGVGPKVANCVCLMSLDKHDCVPVDTHVWQIATRDYKFRGKSKTASGNKSDYEAITLLFQNLWGKYAGWAHSVLFTADLKDLNNGVNKTDAKETIVKKTIKRKKVVKSLSTETTPNAKIEVKIKSEETKVIDTGLRRSKRIKTTTEL